MNITAIQNMNVGEINSFNATKKSAKYIAGITGQGRFKGCIKTTIKKHGDDIWHVTVRCIKKVPAPKTGGRKATVWTQMMKSMDTISAFTWKSHSFKVEMQIRRSAYTLNGIARYQKFSVRKVADGIRVSRVNLDPTVEYDVK